MVNTPWAWHVHHRNLVERLQGPNGLTERQSYIKREKPYKERVRRLRLLKVVENQELVTSLKTSLDGISYKLPHGVRRGIRMGIIRAINTLHAHECQKCPWNGKTIFPKKPKKVKK